MSPNCLKRLKVLEFTHAVMGPSCGMILGDLGAEVVHVEPLKGSPTRDLKGFGSGYFSYFNRSKESLTLDLKSKEGLELAKSLAAKADILVENFAPGTMERLGLGYESLKPLNKGLIYCSLKGFLPGPYEKRAAMDEVVQMMGGLAYMTGPRDRPLRAGSSVVDITGGMFGVIGILSALNRRHESGVGAFVNSSLFETTAFLMGQHMAWSIRSQTPIPPMPERVSAWSVYQVFETQDEPVFIGLISEKHWTSFCKAFAREDLLERPEYASNNLRIDSRETLLPDLKQMMAQMTKADVMKRCEEAGIPFAPIARPEDLFKDPHLAASNALAQVQFPTGEEGLLPKLPIEIDKAKHDPVKHPPKAGADSRHVLQSWLGKSSDEQSDLIRRNIVGEWQESKS